MSYGGYPYGGVAYAASDVALMPQNQTQTTLAIEVAFTTDPLAEPAWVDITPDVRSWSTSRGRRRELERFQPGRATVVLDNRTRQYDSVYSAGPWFGKLKPMKRMRIRETFNGVTYPVFDGFVDRWQLDYPNTGRDSTATLTATDAMKVFNRAQLRPSVYRDAVLDDNPNIYWPMDEQRNGEPDATLLALNYSTLGATGDGTYVGPPRLGGEPLVVKDKGGSAESVNSTDQPGTVGMGVELAAASFMLFPIGTESFGFEGWCIPRNTPGTNGYLLAARNGAGTVKVELLYTSSSTFVFNVNHDVTPVSLSTSPTTFVPHQRYHIVGRCVVGETLRLWVNGVQFTGGTPAGTLGAGGLTRVGYVAASGPTLNWSGAISQVSLYRDSAASAIDQTWVTRHYSAGTAPLDGDLPGTRIGRYLDEASWPASLRSIDSGQTTFQSDDWDTNVLEKLQKASESEYASLWFMSRDGLARFVDRTHALAREPYPVAFSDTVGEIGYRQLVPDDGDSEIRNRATISRLNGAARTATDAASISSLGAFQYTLEGLLHDSDTVSRDYAAFIVDQYGDQRRRISSIALGPPVTGTEAATYPAMLGLELGDAITVQHTPIGVGSEFSQVCVIEGIDQSGAPGGQRETRFALSPEYPIRTLEDVDVSTLGYAEVTANQGSITAEVDLTSLTVTVTVGSNRRIRITGYVPALSSSVAGDGGRLSIKESTTLLQLAQDEIGSTAAGASPTLIAQTVEMPSAGSHTYKLTAQRVSGTGTLTMNADATFPAYILVEDIGPQ